MTDQEILNIKQNIVAWTQTWFEDNGKDCVACVAVSGGKDSSVTAALCVEALGKDRVYGVLMPQDYQRDIDMSLALVDFLDIKYTCINIGETVDTLFKAFPKNFGVRKNYIAKTNTPARIRMTTLYAVAACVNGRVANTCNLSENTVSYSTKYGDSAGDFGLLGFLTVTEVKQLGYALGLPAKFIEKVPEDGLSGKTDEENFGFSYDVLDRYIRTGICEDEQIKNKIENMRRFGLHKLRYMDEFRPEI